MFKLSNEQYDNTKRLAQLIIPALGTFYFAIAKIWNLPYGTEVVGTLSAIDVFLGAVLGYSSSQYYKDNQE